MMQNLEFDGGEKTENDKISSLQEDLMLKHRVISKMEQTEKSLNSLLADRDEMIENQKKILAQTRADSAETDMADLKEVRNIISIKEAELTSCQDEIT